VDDHPGADNNDASTDDNDSGIHHHAGADHDAIADVISGATRPEDSRAAAPAYTARRLATVMAS
ncbi:MAG: hypothetical protein ACRDTS_21890, partial [Mycobacterium sp.]